jgi:hypothetical protein
VCISKDLLYIEWEKMIGKLGFLGLIFSVLLTGCSSNPDEMPPTMVDIFVLDLSTSNDKNEQLKRLDEDLRRSLTYNGLGVPKPVANEKVSGPVTTIFTFIEESALRAETFKLQDALTVKELWQKEFANDKKRNASSWSALSSAYNSYLRGNLENFSMSNCLNDLDQSLSPKFIADQKRTRIVRILCDKLKLLAENYLEMRNYVAGVNAPATDIFGMLSKVDRLISQIKKNDPDANITVNIGSDMQHETGDSRDTPAKLTALNFDRNQACNQGRVDRQREGLSFDEISTLKVSGIGNANVSAEFGNSLVRYWECFFQPNAEIR